MSAHLNLMSAVNVISVLDMLVFWHPVPHNRFIGIEMVLCLGNLKHIN